MTFTYKGYTGSARLDEEGQLWHGKVTNINDIVTFHAERLEDVEQEFQRSVDTYLEFLSYSSIHPNPRK